LDNKVFNNHQKHIILPYMQYTMSY